MERATTAKGDEGNELVRFAKLFKLMRSLQRAYFDGDRSATTLAQARDTERRVDKAIAWIVSHRQGSLFQ